MHNKAEQYQYLLAMSALMAVVINNLFGVESTTLNSLCSTIITATVWGGYQRKRGRLDKNQKENDL